MAKIIKKENVAKKITVSEEIDGKMVSTQTTKNCVGKKIPAAPKCIACQKVNAKGNQTKVAIICNAKTPVPAKPKPTARVKNSDLEDCVDFVMQNHKTLTRKDMVKHLAKDSARSEGGWKTMVGAICLSLKHLNTPGGGAFGWAADGLVNHGINSFKELKKYVAQKENKEEIIIGRSVNYVWVTWKNL